MRIFSERLLTFPFKDGIIRIGKGIEYGKRYAPWIVGIFLQWKECFYMQVYKAIKYIRLSYTDDKTVESDSVANQRRLVDDWY